MSTTALQLHEEQIQLLFHAREFERASECLSRQAMEDRSNIRSLEDIPIYASFPVMSAFAFELYLKLLLHIENRLYPMTGRHFPKRHELMTKLFSEVTPRSQNKIQSLYEAAWSENWRNYPGHPMSPLPFVQAMQAANGAFVEWRYQFDGATPTPLRYHGTLIIPHVKTVIFDEKPELEQLLRHPNPHIAPR